MSFRKLSYKMIAVAAFCGYGIGMYAQPKLNATNIDEVINAMKAGELHVFDASTFTVNGEAPVSDHIYDGYFHESETGSAPYFDLRIDGIEELG